LKSAPKVACHGRHVEMTMRVLAAAKGQYTYVATYRCPKCGTDTEREFAVFPADRRRDSSS
jgi:hypothetical protein